jgi:large subunit ribosomal protein L13
MTTFMPESRGLRPVDSKWRVVDAERQVLGRLASQVAAILRGKDKPTFTPHADTGDYVIVVNAARVRLTGRKLDDKIYYRHTMYPGGIKAITAGDMLAKHPERVVELAVRRMLPKTKMGRHLITKLKVYAGPEHPHAAQKPTPHALVAQRKAAAGQSR